MKIRKGDTIQVLRGKDQGKKGKVEKVFQKTDKLLVGGINVVTKHQKPKQGVKQVGRIAKSMPIGISNVAIVCDKCGKYVKIGYKILTDGRKERICRKCGESI
jgi:large subunit ribosomal protein L24